MASAEIFQKKFIKTKNTFVISEYSTRSESKLKIDFL